MNRKWLVLMVNEQIVLLNKIKSIENSSLKFILSEETKTEAKTSAGVTADKKWIDNSFQQKTNHERGSQTKTVKKKIPQPIISELTKQDISDYIAQVEAQIKMNEIVNLPNNEISSGNSNLDEDKWKEVKGKRRRNVIIGNNSSEIVKGVPKYTNLRVYRLNLERRQMSCLIY
ncbi:hypothetical protein JTB14_036535 [Gonioctena quinquepunctata]|nr:hypothetical protein JTB14_036535 [Gonioctena quinquepunctata]